MSYRRPKLHKDTSGTVAPLMALLLVVTAGIISLSIDYANLWRVNSKLQAAADSAALDAAASALTLLSKNGATGEEALSTAISTSKAEALRLFEANAKNAGFNDLAKDIAVKIDKGLVTVSLNYSGIAKTIFGNVLGFNHMNIAGVATANATLPPFVEVYLLVDTSGSMALGASPADQQRLIDNIGCAFACHDGAPVNGYADAYDYAKGQGIALRYDAVRAGIGELLDKIDAVDKGHQYISVAVYSFNNDITLDAPLTTNTTLVRSKLPSAPTTSGELLGATHFKEIIPKVIADIGSGGDGRSPANPAKLLIIATDGAQDPNRTWTSDIPLRAEVDAFDMSFCEPAKDDGIHIGIIHTPYLPMTWDWGYNATLGEPSQIGGPGTRADDIPIVLQNCAGERYIEADNYTAIRSAFTKIFESLGGVTLTH